MYKNSKQKLHPYWLILMAITKAELQTSFGWFMYFTHQFLPIRHLVCIFQRNKFVEDKEK